MKATVSINYIAGYGTTEVPKTEDYDFHTIRDAKDFAVYALSVWGTRANIRQPAKNAIVVTVVY